MGEHTGEKLLAPVWPGRTTSTSGPAWWTRTTGAMLVWSCSTMLRLSSTSRQATGSLGLSVRRSLTLSWRCWRLWRKLYVAKEALGQLGLTYFLSYYKWKLCAYYT